MADIENKTSTALDRARERAEKARKLAEAAATRARQARAALSRLETRKSAPERKADFRRKVIIGAALLKECPELVEQVLSKMPPVVRQQYDEATRKAEKRV